MTLPSGVTFDWIFQAILNSVKTMMDGEMGTNPVIAEAEESKDEEVSDKKKKKKKRKGKGKGKKKKNKGKYLSSLE